MSAVARAKGQLNCECAEQPSHVIRQSGGARVRRGPIWFAGQKRYPAKCVRYPSKAGAIRIRAGLSVPRYSQQDELGVDGRKNVPAQSPFFECAGLEILADDVTDFYERFEDLDAFLLTQIKAHRFLIACLAQPDIGIAGLALGAKASRMVSDLRQFDLQNLGAVFSHQRRSKRCCNEIADIQNP